MNIPRSLSLLATSMLMFLVMHVGGHLHAQEPRVRASMATTGTVYVGQPATLVVELLAPGYFASAATFDLPEAPGLVLIPPTGSPVIGTEEVDGVSFTVQRHEVAVLAQRAGEVAIPAFSVRFQFKRAPLDKTIVPAAVKTPEVRFATAQPPGTEKLGQIISARDLQVTESWSPDPAKTHPKAGDAFTRTITFTAPDVPGMMFPPFRPNPIDGIGIHRRTPEVHDHSERGILTGQRRDVVTYTLERAGSFTLPPVRFSWWDLQGNAVRTTELPALTLQVAPNPALASAASPASPGTASLLSSWKAVAALLAGLALIVFFFRSTPVRAALARFTSQFRRVHLQPLNPTQAPRRDP